MTTPAPALVVLVATGSQDEARTIARAAVERHLAGCAQLMPIESVYMWEGAVQQDAEYLVLLKTREPAYPALEQAIRELHSYDVPEILALPVVGGLPAYLSWLAGVVGDTAGA